ncbi:hypothetical protein FJY93_02645 [Candidatus Kaiserbacteria bacterium]|nr:hypothetical protein [Candidatus Kaiserbacteria bacterium]
MNTITLKLKAAAMVMGATLAFGAALPAFAIEVNRGAPTVAAKASTTVKAKTSDKALARIEKGKERAKEEIARRIAALGALAEKVQAMARVSDDMKASISGTVQSQITMLLSLQAKIEADTDLDTLKADIKSITESYRIFMLVLPQGRIATAADSLQITAASLTTLAGKLETRIAEAQAKGGDTAALSASLADMKTKIDSAKASAEAAIALTATLKPDNGDKAIADANKKALKDAQAKLKAAREDIKSARKMAGDIAKALKEMRVSASAAATTTATTTQ